MFSAQKKKVGNSPSDHIRNRISKDLGAQLLKKKNESILLCKIIDVSPLVGMTMQA